MWTEPQGPSLPGRYVVVVVVVVVVLLWWLGEERVVLRSSHPLGWTGLWWTEMEHLFRGVQRCHRGQGCEDKRCCAVLCCVCVCVSLCVLCCVLVCLVMRCFVLCSTDGRKICLFD